jgi:hypothetical protein
VCLLEGLEEASTQGGGDSLLTMDPLSLLDRPWEDRHNSNIDFDSMIPSDMWVGSLPVEPKIGRVLAAELKQLTEQEWVGEMAKLQLMTAREVEDANKWVCTRLLFAQIEWRIPAVRAFNMSSDPEEDKELPNVQNGTGASQKKTQAGALQVVPTADPPAKSSDSVLTIDPAAAAATTNPVVTVPMVRPQMRPRIRLERPEENVEAEGSLQDPGMQRPEVTGMRSQSTSKGDAPAVT